MFSYEINKFLKSKKSIYVFVILMVLGIVASVIAVLCSNDMPDCDYHPAYVSLLSGGDGNVLSIRSIFTWSMPMFLIFGYCGKSINERKHNTNNIYLTKSSRKNYFFSKIGASFFTAVIYSFFPHIINLLINMIFLHNGTFFCGLESFRPMIDTKNEYLLSCVEHPYSAYTLYLLSSLFVVGLLGIMCQSICFIFKDNKWSYLSSVAIWNLYFASGKTTVNAALQPFCNYTVGRGLRSLAMFIPSVLLCFVVAYVLTVVKKDEI